MSAALQAATAHAAAVASIQQAHNQQCGLHAAIAVQTAETVCVALANNKTSSEDDFQPTDQTSHTAKGFAAGKVVEHSTHCASHHDLDGTLHGRQNSNHQKAPTNLTTKAVRIFGNTAGVCVGTQRQQRVGLYGKPRGPAVQAIRTRRTQVVGKKATCGRKQHEGASHCTSSPPRGASHCTSKPRTMGKEGVPTMYKPACQQAQQPILHLSQCCNTCAMTST